VVRRKRPDLVERTAAFLLQLIRSPGFNWPIMRVATSGDRSCPFSTGILADSTLIARKLGSTHRILCASPDYLARRGVLVASADLARHDCVIAGASTSNAHWVLDGPRGQETVAVSGRFAANEMQPVVAAAIAGYGIAQLPYQVAEAAVRDGQLRRVLGDYTTPVGGLYAVYPSSRHVSPLVKAFIDLAAERLAAAGTGEDDKDIAVFNQSFG
jgi:DNA-binding transcriptional LysR family regulator